MSHLKTTGFQWILLFVSGVIIILTLILINENHIVPDSQSYISMSIMRDPGYPLFIAFFRTAFGESYLYPMLAVQNIIFTVAVWQFVIFIQNRYRLSFFSAAVLQAACLGWVLINIAIFSQHYINQVLTEGIAISLFFFVMRYMVVAAVNCSYKAIWKSLPFIAVSMLTRMQMAWMLVLWLIVFIYIALCKKELKRRILLIITVFLGMFVFISLFTRTYHFIKNNHFVPTQFTASSVLTKMLYLSDNTDATLFDNDAQAKRLFEEVYASIYEDKLTYQHASGGLFDKRTHYALSYEKILYGNLHPIKNELISDWGYSGTDLIIYGEQLCSRMIVPLLKDNFRDYITVTMRVFVDGALKSNFWISDKTDVFSIICRIMSILAYCVYFGLMLLLVIQKKGHPALVFSFVFLVALLGSITPNVLTHYIVNRYAIYTIGMFYTVILVMLSELNLKPLCFLKMQEKALCA